MSSGQTVLARLSSLEDKDEAKTKEIQKLRDSIYVLQKENFDFKTELFNVQRENGSLKEKLESMEKKMTNLMQDIPGGNKSSPKDSKTDTNDNLKRTVSALIKDTKRLQKSNQDSRNNISTLTKKVDNVQSNVNMMSRLQKALNRTIVNKQTEQDVNEKVDDLCRRTDAIELRRENLLQSVTSVLLTTKGKLSTGHYVKLDECISVDINRGAFNQTSCCLTPLCDGDYGVGVLPKQKNEGVIDILLNRDVCINRHVGQTRYDGNSCFGMQCLSLKKGQKVWVTAYRLKGVAEMKCCRVFFWFLG